MQPEASAYESCTGNASCARCPLPVCMLNAAARIYSCVGCRGVKQGGGPGMAAAARLQACHHIEASLRYAVLLWVPAPVPHIMPRPLLDCHLPPGFAFWGTMGPTDLCHSKLSTGLQQCSIDTPVQHVNLQSKTGSTPAKRCKTLQESQGAVKGCSASKTECIGWRLTDSIVNSEFALNTRAAALQMSSGFERRRLDHISSTVQGPSRHGAYLTKADVQAALSQSRSLLCTHNTA